MGNTLQNIGQNQSEQNQEHELHVIEQPDEPQNFTSEICIESMLLPNRKFKNHNLCVHPFCTDCIIKYITVKLEDNIGNIPCPSLNCNQFFDPISCRNLIGAELFVKWCDVLCESAVLGLAHCYCPNQSCSALIQDECGGMQRNRIVQISRVYSASSASFHGTLGYAVGNLGMKTMSLFVCLLSVINGRDILNVTTLLNVPKVAELSTAGVVPISATNVEEELLGTGVILGQFYCFN